MDIDTPELTFTGGEPTLLGRKLVNLIHRAKNFLPHTALHLLTNGRLLRYLAFAKDIADVHHPDLVLGIPIYSDVSHEHDFIVQAESAFDETVKGILNAARCGLQVELRIVITSLNFKVLPRLAGFIARNFPFSCNVALMGLEPVGFGKANLNTVWVDPVDSAEHLRAAIRCLQSHRVPVSIYNHQLCTLSQELWHVARQSISDWKNIFVDACQQCSVRHQCCGFFASASEVHSRGITPVLAVSQVNGR
jgi:His-Xaa-Ser system radical SAM maturase HxsC